MSAFAISGLAISSASPCNSIVHSVSGLGMTFIVSSVSTDRRAVSAGLQLAHVVAGDVLDDLAAGLPDLAAAVDGGEAEEEIARRAGAHPAGSAEIAGDHAAERRLAAAAEEAAPVRAARRPASAASPPAPP